MGENRKERKKGTYKEDRARIKGKGDKKRKCRIEMVDLPGLKGCRTRTKQKKIHKEDNRIVRRKGGGGRGRGRTVDK